MKRVYEMYFDEDNDEILVVLNDHSELRIMVAVVEESIKPGPKKSPNG